MKRTNVIAIALIFALSILGANDASAKGRNGQGKHNGSCRNINRDSLRNIMETQVLPELLEIKSGFDSKLSSDDLTALNSLRQRAAELRKESFGKMRQQSPKPKDMTAEQKETFRKEMGEKRASMEAIFKDLKEITNKNSTLVENLQSQLSQLKEKYGNAMMFKGADPKMIEQSGDTIRLPKRMRHGMRKNPVDMFLLWDGSKIVPDEPNLMTKMQNPVNFPNPFNSSTNIKFSLPRAGKVVVDLYDNTGNFIETIYNGMLESGENTIQFNSDKVKNLNPGVLVYKIKAEGYETSGKMLFKK